MLVNSSVFLNGLCERSDTQPGIVNNGMALLDRNKSLRTEKLILISMMIFYLLKQIFIEKYYNILFSDSSSINDVHILLRRLCIFLKTCGMMCICGACAYHTALCGVCM